mgnify:CR=1 FL=1
MGYHASKVELSYEFTRAIPTDNPKYKVYQEFRSKFGEDGNLMVIALQSPDFFKPHLFNDYSRLVKEIKKLPSIEEVLSIPGAVDLYKDTVEERLLARTIFPAVVADQVTLDSAVRQFERLPFYKGVLYNPDTHTYLMGVRINKQVMVTRQRNAVVGSILEACRQFEHKHGVAFHYSGLPLIRTNIYASIVARAVELVHACAEALDLIDAYRPPTEPLVPWTPRAGVAAWATEAPRGMLFPR